jgi:hypothetical protein
MNREAGTEYLTATKRKYSFKMKSCKSLFKSLLQKYPCILRFQTNDNELYEQVNYVQIGCITHIWASTRLIWKTNQEIPIFLAYQS